jgi:D-psicose/D-tagatose/L-ribulose 3-epimerase
MKYGAHCYIFTERWSDDSLDLLDTACELGLDCFEIGVGDDVIFSPKLTRQRAESLGLELLASPGGLWPRQCDLASAEADHRQMGLLWHKRQVDIAAELGATAYTGALYGHPGVLHYHPLTMAELAPVADGLHELACYAQPRGVHIVIEPMSHFRTHVANNASQAMQLIHLADHSNLLVLLDTYHLVTEVRDYAAQIKLIDDRLWGLHACESDRGAPGGGLVPWSAVREGLREVRFDGYIIFESYNSSIGNPPGDFAQRRGMLHDVCHNGSTFVRTSLEFMHSLLD